MNLSQFNSLKNLSGPIMITGHTGFKGVWLSLLLERMGVANIGFSLPPESGTLYSRINSYRNIPGEFADIRSRDSLRKFMKKYNPTAVIHLAAQPLVLNSYKEPVETFETNLMGTVNVLQVASEISTVKAVILATTDKVYENNESGKFFKESDPLRGKDPYSASKVAAEAAVDAWREISKLNAGPKITAVRAGNVIGGGDWAENRLLPDAIRSFSNSEPLIVRSPNSIRPWQHVLDPLFGYLAVLTRAINEEEFDVRAVNFSPKEFGLSVREVVEIAKQSWKLPTSINFVQEESRLKKESGVLNLNADFAQKEFGWNPHWSQEDAVRSTISWWRDHLLNEIDADTLCRRNIDEMLEK